MTITAFTQITSELTIIQWIQNNGPYSQSIQPLNSLLKGTVDPNKEKEAHAMLKKKFKEKGFH